MQDINVNRKYYSLRSLNLENDEYYTTIKNQTLQQNSFFTFSVPRQVIHAKSEGVVSVLDFESKFYVGASSGELTLFAGGEEPSPSGSWVGLILNGTTITSGTTQNPWVITERQTGVVIVDGYNTIEGTFDLDSNAEISVICYWSNSWEA